MKLLLTSAFLLVIVSACKKDKCEPGEPVSIFLQNEIYVGWPITFKSDDYEAAKMIFSGPNGYRQDFDRAPLNNGLTITDSAVFENSGLYTGRYYRGNNCLKAEASAQVTVLPIPNPSCVLANNTGTTTVDGIGPTTYSSVTTDFMSYYYDIKASSTTSHYLRITFRTKNQTKPLPGKYNTIGGDWIPSGEIKCAIFLRANGTDYMIKSTESIYVNIVNNQHVYTLCNAEFINHTGSEPLFISAKIVVP